MASRLLNCTEVTPLCPVELTTLSYRPNLGANAFYLSIFALCAFFQLILGIRYKTWTFMIALVLGCLAEVVGYAGRVMLWNNPWSSIGFIIQIVFLIFAPAFIAAGIYLTLKHLVLEFGERYSVLRPAKLYTWLFISADITSLVMQSIGAAVAASADSTTTAQTGSDVALAGIVFQVFALLVFAVLFAWYFVRVYRERNNLTQSSLALTRSLKFRAYIFAIALATITVLIRCVYRIPELAGEWRNAVFRNEIDFIFLDGMMITIAVLALTIAHPGYCFGGLSKGRLEGSKEAENGSSEDEVEFRVPNSNSAQLDQH